MILDKLRSVPFILIEDDINTNIIPLLLDLIQHDKHVINLFSYEQPPSLWTNIFKHRPNVNFYKAFVVDEYSLYVNSKCTVVIHSVNQMSLCLGWSKCLQSLQILHNDKNVEKLIIVLHKDCVTHTSKLFTNLNHITTAVVSYDNKNPCKILVKIKKGNKVLRSEEMLSYDTKTSTLKSTSIVKEITKDDELQTPCPGNLTTFKIEVEQTEKLEKYKLKLPYMSKINEGESKIYYEPDAVDDWDEEDPDDDLNI